MAPKIFLGAAAVAAAACWCGRRRPRTRLEVLLDEWCRNGSAHEPVVECQVPVSHGLSGDDIEYDVVEVPVGLVFECRRLLECVAAHLQVPASAEHVPLATAEALAAVWGTSDKQLFGPDADTEQKEVVALDVPWLDLAALAQLTYWYDRRPQSYSVPVEEVQEQRLTEAKFGRWTKKVSREKVVYGTVALRYRTRGHLGQQVFRRPAGIDVTRLATLRRAAALCGHDDLTDLVEQTMEQLKPKNVAKIPFAEVCKHNTREDLWLLIDSKVYDVTPFLDLHPGGGQLIMDAAGYDATSMFERTHGEGLRYSLRLLNQFFIGDCVDAQQAKQMDPDPCTPEFIQTLRSITGALHTFDEAKATGEAQGLLRR